MLRNVNKERRKAIRMLSSRHVRVLATIVLMTGLFAVIEIPRINSYDLRNRILRARQTLKSKSPDRRLQEGNETLKIAWFMSFPDAGVVYITRLIHTVSQTSTSSNDGTMMIDAQGHPYGIESNSIPVYENQNGPSLSSGSLPLPETYILTRTHSHGTCFDCPPWKYLGPAAELMHKRANNHAMSIVDGTTRNVEYSMDLVEKMVILVRDPMDNIAARFSNKVRREVNSGNTAYGTMYPKNKIGFAKYCDDMNGGTYGDKEKNWYTSKGFWEEAFHIPCRSEFVKLFSFYNNVRILGLTHELEMKTVSVKGFAVDVDNTIDDVFDFVNLTRVNPPPVNLLGSGERLFLSFYTHDERYFIALLAKKMLHPEVYDGFATYLDKYLF